MVAVVVAVQFGHQFQNRVDHLLRPLRRQQTALHVDQRHAEALEHHLVIVRGKGAVAQQLLRLLQRGVRVVGEHTLVEAFDRGQRRAVPKDHVQELEPRDMPPQHHQAESERGGQDEADGPPQPRPEDRRHHHRKRRQAGAVAVDERLYHLADRELHHAVERDRPKGPWTSQGRPNWQAGLAAAPTARSRHRARNAAAPP